MFENFDWSQIALFSGDFADFKHYEDVINSVLAVICVICAGLAAGLTMGLLSLDVTKLEIKAMTGSSVDRADAEAILPIVKKHHLLLVTLLLFNSMANEALPVFLSALLPEWLSVLISVTLVLVFGEILPSAFFTGKAQLHTAAIMIPFVKTLTYLFWPVGFPLSFCLDWVFGVEEETSVISREELGALVFLQNSDRSRRKGRGEAIEALKIQSSPKVPSDKTPPTAKKSKSSDSLSSDSSDESDEGLSTYEINIMTGILKLAKLHVRDSMIKIKSVYMISDSTRLDIGTLERLWNCGFSRIPVFRRRDKQHIIGYLLIKSLILVSLMGYVILKNQPESLFISYLCICTPCS
jgi:metal transporter CNNM